MTAILMWRPLSAGTSLGVGAPSSVIDCIKKVFGSFPYTFDHKDISKLEVLSELYGEPYSELIEAIEKFAVIEIYAIY
jgi:hypothetical protein